MRGLKHDGSILLPLGLLLGTGACLILGTLNLLQRWHVGMATQLRLDRCTGHHALHLKEVLQKLDSLNQRISELRIAAEAALVTANSPGVAATQAALNSVVDLQDLELQLWSALRMKAHDCGKGGKAGDRLFPLPALSLFRPPPDPIGPHPLHWETGAPPSHFMIQASHSPCSSQAEVFRSETQWRARWSH